MPPPQQINNSNSLFLGSLLSSLGDLASTSLGLLDGLDNTHSDGLSHITDGETAQRWVIGECLDAHGLRGNHLDHGSVTGLDELGGRFHRLAGPTIDLLEQFVESASDVGGMAVQHGCVSSADLARVVEQDDLGGEVVDTRRGIVLGVTGHVATTDILDRDVLDVETHVISRDTFLQLLVVHFHRLDFGGDVGRGESDDHSGGDGTRFDPTDRDGSDTRDLVDILQRETEWLVDRTDRRLDGIDGFQQGLSCDLAGLGLLLPSLVPGAVGGRFNHVVTLETGHGHERRGLGVVADLLDEVGRFLDDFVVAVLRPLARVHLVEGDDELSHA